MLKNICISLSLSVLTLLKPVPDLRVELINSRRNYYPRYLGQIFENKGYYYLEKAEDIAFKLIDPNFYLFNSHPREND